MDEFNVIPRTGPLSSIQGSLWRSSGISIRTSFICPLHIGCSQTCRGTWPWCSPLCRWHPTVWPLFICQFFWVGVSSSSSYWLNSWVQNMAARVVVMGRKRDHIGPVLKDLHWLPVKKRITLKLATTVFKTLSCSEPSYLLELMEDYKPSRSLRSSQKQLLNIPRCRTKIASRAFSVAAPSVWNSIEIEIRQSDSVASFKRKLKTRLFESSFS